MSKILEEIENIKHEVHEWKAEIKVEMNCMKTDVSGIKQRMGFK